MPHRPPPPPQVFDDVATSQRIGRLALAFCVGGAAALFALHATKARARPAGPADGVYCGSISRRCRPTANQAPAVPSATPPSRSVKLAAAPRPPSSKSLR